MDQLEQLSAELSKARSLLLSGDIEPADFRIMKADNEERTRKLENRLANLRFDQMAVDKLIAQALGKMERLADVYVKGDTETKRGIIGSMFPEKLEFDGFKYRTTRTNEVVQLIYTLGKG